MNALRTFQAGYSAVRSLLLSRRQFGRAYGESFDGQRDLIEALGYPDKISLKAYLGAYARGGIAKRLVDIYPLAIWGGGVELVEDPDPGVETPFENTARKLFERLNIWGELQNADVLSRLGEYSVLLIGAGGDLSQELPKLNGPSDVLYITPYAQLNAKINQRVTDVTNARFGLPLSYNFTTTDATSLSTGGGGTIPAVGPNVHWSRVIHIVGERLSDRTLGIPMLEIAWNDLLDLLKVKGGGSEAAWRRMDPGFHIEIPEGVEIDEKQDKKLKEGARKLQHGADRILVTEGGVKINPQSAQVTNYGSNVRSTVELICSPYGIPIRILLGNTAGERATRDDRDQFNDRARAQRVRIAVPNTRLLVDRFIEFGALPEPAQYDPVWPIEDGLTALERSTVVRQLAVANKAQGEVIITSDEIRAGVLNLESLEDAGVSEGDTGTGDGNGTGNGGENGDESGRVAWKTRALMRAAKAL